MASEVKTVTEFLVDRHKHRIVKRDGMWKLYCPERGGDDLILAKCFNDIRHALTLPCSERGGLFGTLYSHGVRISAPAITAMLLTEWQATLPNWVD